MKSILQTKTCPECDYTFKVIDLDNWVCNNCYSREIPKYIDAHLVKRGKDAFMQFSKKDQELIDLLISEAAAMRGHGIDRDEKEHLDHVCKVLEEEGIWNFERNKACLTGEIDVFVPEQIRESMDKRGRKRKMVVSHPKIIEGKRNHSGTLMKQALGQLLFYGTAHPDADLYITTPSALPKAYIKIFALYNVKEWG